jgi:hypothetical protein
MMWDEIVPGGLYRQTGSGKYCILLDFSDGINEFELLPGIKHQSQERFLRFHLFWLGNRHNDFKPFKQRMACDVPHWWNEFDFVQDQSNNSAAL